MKPERLQQIIDNKDSGDKEIIEINADMFLSMNRKFSTNSDQNNAIIKLLEKLTQEVAKVRADISLIKQKIPSYTYQLDVYDDEENIVKDETEEAAEREEEV